VSGLSALCWLKNRWGIGGLEPLVEMHVHMLPVTVSIFFKIPIFPNDLICHNAVRDYGSFCFWSFILSCIMQNAIGGQDQFILDRL
jgi:hypothetical protein